MTVNGKVVVVYPGAEAVTVIVWEPCPIGLVPGHIQVCSGHGKVRVVDREGDARNRSPLEVVALSVSTTLPATALAATELDPLTPIVIAGLPEATTAIVKVRSAVVYPGAEAVRSTV